MSVVRAGSHEVPRETQQPSPGLPGDLEVAVLVPCHDEEAAIGSVVRDFRVALPGAIVYVYDNASTDATAARAREQGAVVRREAMKGL